MSEEKKACDQPGHKNHMCYLKAHGLTAEIESAIGNQSVECGICGAKASSADYICTPAKPFEDEQGA
jgi:hypothetical protein